MGLAELLELMAHLGDDGLAHVPRQPHRGEGGLDPLAHPHVVALELGLAPRPGPLAQFLFQLFELGAQVLQLVRGVVQLLEQLLVGFGPALLVGIGGLFAFLEDVAQVGLAGLDPVAQVDKKIQRDRRFEDLFFDLLFAGLDPLGDFDLLLAREQLEVAHLLEVEPYRVGRIARRVGRLFFGFFLGLRLDFALGALGGDFLEDLDIHVLEALQRGTQVGGRGHVLGQEIVDLVESQVTLLAAEVDQTLEILPFVLLLHAFSFRPGRRSRLSAADRSICGLAARAT